MITQNDHPRYVKRDLAFIFLFFNLFVYWVRRGGSPKG